METALFFPTLTAPYKKWPDKKLSLGAESIFVRMKDNEYYPTLSEEVNEFGLLSKDFAKKIAEAFGGGRDAIIAKDMARIALVRATLRLGNSVSQVANGDLQALASSGFELRKRPRSVVLGTPSAITIITGNQEGRLQTKMPAVTGARSYAVRYTMDPLTPESIWQSITCTTRKCVINELQSGRKYWIMIGAVGGKGQTNWSATHLSGYVP